MASVAAVTDLSVVLEALPIGVIKTDQHWTISYLNAAAERLLGIARETVLHQPISAAAVEFP
jgi:PAS domain-containing protein